jgi:putative ABC transport system permease protein
MSVLADLRLSCRALINSPGFTVVAVTMLALGIGVNATVFTVTNAVLFKGFPLVQRNDRLVYITPKGSNCCVSYPDFLDWRAQAKSFEGMAIVHGVGKILSDPSGFAERLDATEVSANTFQLVGQRPILGRDFAPSDEIPGAPAVAMLSYGFWESRYGKDPAVVGRALRMNDVRTTVIGVMPSGFSFPQKQDLWVPLVATPTVLKRENRDTWMAIGRMSDGVTIQSAQREMEVIGKRLASAYPVTNQDLIPEVQNFTQFFIGADAATLYGAMWGAVGFVLLIACANLANLLLARAIGRSREISIRIALGAGRWRIIRQLLIESVLLSGIGGFFGWWIAKWGVCTYALAMAQKASWLIVDYTMDHGVLGYLIAISIGTGLIFGMAPALRLSKLDVNVALKDGGRGATVGGRGKHLSAILVIGEMALAVVLLAGAGVMIRSFLKVHSATLGINTANVLTGSVALPANQYPGADAQISFFERLTTHLEGIPGVESVAIADATPQFGARRLGYEIEGDPDAASQDARRRPSLHVVVVSPKYFHTLQATMLAGRDFNDHDSAAEMPLAIVNQRFADKFWPGEDPLGKRLRLFDGNTQPAWRTVVGVVSNINQSDETRQQFDPLIYLPYRQKPFGVMWIFARTSVPPDHLATAFRRELQTLDRDLPLYGPITLEKRLEVFSDRKFYGALFVIFAAIALLLASIGLYTVIAHSVSQRTQEIGIRIAIGATARDIRRLVLFEGLLPLAIGLAIGLAVSFAVNRLLKSQLVQVSPADPVTLIVASGVLILAATLGCMLPVRRAMRVDPVIALRHE